MAHFISYKLQHYRFCFKKCPRFVSKYFLFKVIFYFLFQIEVEGSILEFVKFFKLFKVKMERISTQDRTKIVKLYFATNSVVLAQRTFRREFPGRHCSCARTIKRLVDKFKNIGGVVDGNKGHSSQPFSARSSAKIPRSKRLFAAIPTKINKVAVTGGPYFKDICTKNCTHRLNIVSIQDTNPPTTN